MARHTITLGEEDIRKAVEAHYRERYNVAKVTLEVSRGYEGSQLDSEAPSVRAVVEYVEKPK
jgi:hypothetical protein